MKKFLVLVSMILILDMTTSSYDSYITTFQNERVLPTNIININYIINAYHKNTETFHGYYSRPKFPNTFHNAEILNQFYQDQFYQGYQEMKQIRNSSSENFLAPDVVYAYDHTFEVTFISKHVLSILENTYIFSGGAHPDIINDAHTFSLLTGKEITLKDIFFLYTDAEKKLKEFITKHILQNQEDYFLDAKKTIQEMPLEKFKFYIDRNGIVVFFNPYEIAPYVRGIVEFVIPM